LATITGLAQESYTSKKGDVHLLGNIDLEDLRQAPYDEWFEAPSEADYQLRYGENLENHKVKIFLGTWCGDTKEWLPEFIKLWRDNGLSEDQLEFIALHNEDEQYKRSPGQEEVAAQVHRVPTFIFYEEGKEVGRIVESPSNDLATDIDQIAIGLPSKPRYGGAAILFDAFEKEPIDSLFEIAYYRPLLYKVYDEAKGPSELNTLGYVLKARGAIREAELVFYMNRNLFKYNPNTWDSLGEIYLFQEKYDDAKANYARVLELDPKNKNAEEMLKKIEEKS